MHFKWCIEYVNCITHRFAFLPWHPAPRWISSPHNALTFTVISTVAICTVTHAGVIISGTFILTHPTAGWKKSIYTGIQGLWGNKEGALMHWKQCIKYVNCNTHYRFGFLPWHSAPTWLSSPHNVLTFTVWPTEAICTVTCTGSII